MRFENKWSETTLNYRMMVEFKIPKSQERGWRFDPGCEISSLLDGKLARWSTASCALAPTCPPSVSKKLKEKKSRIKTLDAKIPLLHKDYEDRTT